METPHLFLATLIVLAGLLLPWGLPKEGSANSSATVETQETILVSLGTGGSLPDSTLYTLDPDGSSKTPLFDFHNHPFDTSGGIWHPRIEPGGSAITFSSDSAYLFTPASRNLFRLGTDGSWWTQITPGPNSGRWDQPCPCGVVTGIVRDGSGDPWANRSVYLEGKAMAQTDANGRFRFDNVPTGVRWIVAYKGLGEDVFDAQSVSVQDSLTSDVTLSPDTSYRMEFSQPVRFDDRVYHIFPPHILQWSGVQFTSPVEVYRTTGSCTGIPDIDGFDVAPISGQLAIANYQTGCGIDDTEHQGIYLADKDGNDKRLLVDMMADQNWCGANEIFWSADESRLAAKACYVQDGVWLTYLVVIDATNGSILGGVYFPQAYTIYNVGLHGWSPDGSWLLYSAWLNDASNGTLGKLPVNPDGSLDPTAAVVLLENVIVNGATWGHLDPATTALKSVFLPLVIK